MAMAITVIKLMTPLTLKLWKTAMSPRTATKAMTITAAHLITVFFYASVSGSSGVRLPSGKYFLPSQMYWSKPKNIPIAARAKPA